jgi:hypothetical protein
VRRALGARDGALGQCRVAEGNPIEAPLGLRGVAPLLPAAGRVEDELPRHLTRHVPGLAAPPALGHGLDPGAILHQREVGVGLVREGRFEGRLHGGTTAVLLAPGTLPAVARTTRTAKAAFFERPGLAPGPQAEGYAQEVLG